MSRFAQTATWNCSRLILSTIYVSTSPIRSHSILFITWCALLTDSQTARLTDMTYKWWQCWRYFRAFSSKFTFETRCGQLISKSNRREQKKQKNVARHVWVIYGIRNIQIHGNNSVILYNMKSNVTTRQVITDRQFLDTEGGSQKKLL